MAVVADTTSISNTLVVNTVDTAILTAPMRNVEVVNRGSTGEIWFTVCTVGGPNIQPTVGGSSCYLAASVAGTPPTSVRVNSVNGVVVNLISPYAASYTVQMGNAS
jgi:hypothetical protein